MAITPRGSGGITYVWPLAPQVPSPGNGSNDLAFLTVFWRDPYSDWLGVGGAVCDTPAGWTLDKQQVFGDDYGLGIARFVKVGTLSAASTVNITFTGYQPLAGVAWINLWQCGASETWNYDAWSYAKDGYYGSQYAASYFFGGSNPDSNNTFPGPGDVIIHDVCINNPATIANPAGTPGGGYGTTGLVHTQYGNFQGSGGYGGAAATMYYPITSAAPPFGFSWIYFTGNWYFKGWNFTTRLGVNEKTSTDARLVSDSIGAPGGGLTESDTFTATEGVHQLSTDVAVPSTVHHGNGDRLCEDDLNQGWRDPGQWLMGRTRPAFGAHSNYTAFWANNAWEPLQINVEDYNVGCTYTLNDTRLYLPEDGFYSGYLQVGEYSDGTHGGVVDYLAIRINNSGAHMACRYERPTADQDHSMYLPFSVQAARGDYVQFCVFTSSGANTAKNWPSASEEQSTKFEIWWDRRG